MDNSVERDKRIEEIRKSYADEQKWAGDPEDVRFLLAELSRLQVERDKAIAGLKALADTISPGRGVLYTDKLPKYQYARKVLSELGVPHETT